MILCVSFWAVLSNFSSILILKISIWDYWLSLSIERYLMFNVRAVVLMDCFTRQYVTLNREFLGRQQHQNCTVYSLTFLLIPKYVFVLFPRSVHFFFFSALF